MNDLMTIAATFGGAAAGAASAVWWMFSREITRIQSDMQECKHDLLMQIGRVDGTANRAHTRLDEWIIKR